jgi:hypothetical protein
MRGIHSKFQLTKQTELLNDDETLILDFFMIDIKISSIFYFLSFFPQKNRHHHQEQPLFMFLHLITNTEPD